MLVVTTGPASDARDGSEVVTRDDIDIGQTAAADDAFGGRAQPLVEGGRCPPDHGKGLVGADVVSLHQDALGLTDDSSRVSGLEKPFTFRRHGDRDGGMLSETQTRGQRARTEEGRAPGVEGHRTEGVAVGQRQGQHRAKAKISGMRGPEPPPAVEPEFG